MTSSSSQLVIGYLAILGGMLTTTLSAVCTQALQGAIPDFELSVARSVAQVFFYVIGGKLFGTDFNTKRETIPGLLFLGLAYLVFNVGYYGSTAYLPLSEAYGTLRIASFVTAFLHSRLAFNIEITKSQVISFFVCVVGIILAAQPSFLFHQSERTTAVAQSATGNVSNVTKLMTTSRSKHVGEGINREVLWGYMISSIGGATVGLTYDINRITLKDVTPIVQVTYGAAFCMIGSVVSMLYMEDPVWTMDVIQFMLVLGHSVLSALKTFLFVLAAYYIPGPTYSAMLCLQMVLMIIYQYTIMHSIQPGNYNWIEVFGCIVIIVGGSIPSVVDILAHRAKSKELP